MNISTRTAKKDIEYYSESDKRSVLEKIRTLGIATYTYTNEPTCEKGKRGGKGEMGEIGEGGEMGLKKKEQKGGRDIRRGRRRKIRKKDMLKQSTSPDGYKYLLVYKKAEELLAKTLDFTASFPHEKTLNDLEDQMNRSARSVKANIVEGWKRNATHEYYTFLGYAVASNAELLEDYLDICLGRYEAKGVNGNNGGNGQNRYEAKGVNGNNGGNGIEEKGVRGEKGRNGAEEKGEKGGQGERGERGEIGRMGREELENLRFYPLDSRLPLSVQGYLRAKELNMLLEKLQGSLLTRMREKRTLSEPDRLRLVREEKKNKEDKAEEWYKGELRKRNLVLTARGMKNKGEAEKLGLAWWRYGEPEK